MRSGLVAVGRRLLVPTVDQYLDGSFQDDACRGLRAGFFPELFHFDPRTDPGQQVVETESVPPLAHIDFSAVQAARF